MTINEVKSCERGASEGCNRNMIMGGRAIEKACKQKQNGAVTTNDGHQAHNLKSENRGFVHHSGGTTYSSSIRRMRTDAQCAVIMMNRSAEANSRLPLQRQRKMGRNAPKRRTAGVQLRSSSMKTVSTAQQAQQPSSLAWWFDRRRQRTCCSALHHAHFFPNASSHKAAR